MARITERTATIEAGTPQTVTKDMDVFYNPVMATNRDMSILLLLARAKDELLLCDPLAGSGIRAIRLLKELPAGMVKLLAANDLKATFPQTMATNLKLSGLAEMPENLQVTAQDANEQLLASKGYDYVDIDPFGSPNPFLDAAAKRTRRGGVLAITATDTAPLCGTYPKACQRKYWAKPRRDHLMHEYGLRILARKVQLVAAQYDKALTPICSYSLDHYFRIFFEVQHGKAKVDKILAQHQTIDGHGPLWTGQLWDEALTAKMLELSLEQFPEQEKLLHTLLEESRIPLVGFADVHELARSLKLAGPPKHETIMAALRKEGFQAARTHFSGTGIKTDAKEAELKKLIKKLTAQPEDHP